MNCGKYFVNKNFVYQNNVFLQYELFHKDEKAFIFPYFQKLISWVLRVYSLFLFLFLLF